MTIRRTESRWLWVYVGLLLLAAALRIASFTYGLPYVDHVDEPNFYLLANDQRGVLDAAWRENWLEGYPPGYIWMAAALMQGVDAIADLNIHTDMGNYIAILRLVSLLGDLLTLAALMTLARWLGGAAAGAIAGSGYVIAAEVLENAITALPDPLTVTFVVLCALLTVRALRRDQAAMALLATIFGLLAVVFKYPVFPVLLLPAAFFLRDLWQRRVCALPMATLALLLVGGTALYLLFAYGALNISNSEGLRARTSFFSSVLTPRQWAITLNATIGTLGIPVLALGVFGLVGLVIRRKPRKRLFPLLLVLGVGFLLLAVVPGYVSRQLYPVRYIWPAAALFFVAFAALIAPLLRGRRLLLVGAIALPLFIGAPELLSYLSSLQRPYTYALAQEWFEENVPDGSVLWIEGFLNYRSLSRYEAGYTGYKDFGLIYGRERGEWDGSFEVDYLYLTESQREQWPMTPGWPALEQYTLVKRIGDEAMNREVLYIYSTDPLASQQETPFLGEQTTLRLRGIELVQEGRTLLVPSYWQAPDAPPAVDYSYTLYLTPPDDPADVVLQQDAGLGQRPTSTWVDPEEVLRGGIAPITLPDDLPAGEYAVWLGIYYWETGERLTLDDGRAALRIGEVTVPQ